MKNSKITQLNKKKTKNISGMTDTNLKSYNIKNNKLIVHCGNGSVYLVPGIINMDIPSDSCYLSKDRPDLIAKYCTTIDRYYGKHQDKTIKVLRKGPVIKETVTDVYGYFEKLPFKSNSVDELISVQVIEHFSYLELKNQILPEINRVLKKDGLVRISIPDFERSIELYAETKDKFFVRHIFGPRNSDRGFHIPFRKEDIINLFKNSNFKYIGPDKEIKHDYPAITFQFTKK